MQSKGVESVPSPVSNLVDAFSSRKRQLNHSSFCSAVFEEFKRTYGDADMMSISEDNHIEVLKDQKGELHSGWNEMNSWDWIWGQTPEFSHRIRSEGIDEVKSAFEIALHVKNGIIRSAKVSPQKDEDLQSVVQRLEGTRYNVFADAPMTYGNAVEVKGMDELGLKESEGSRQMNIAKQLLQWLKTVL
jgi:lipoate-protein ligase A